MIALRPLSTSVALIALAGSLQASDLKLDGQVHATASIGSTLQVDLTGNPGLPILLVADADPGPISLFGESIPIGLSPVAFFLPGGATDGTGTYSTSVGVPPLAFLVGQTWHLAGVVLDPLDPNGLDVSNGADVTFTAAGPGFEEVELAGNPLTLRPFFEHVRAFNQGATVEVGLDPLDHPGLAGQPVDLYVVVAKDAGGWDADGSLTDVSSGGAETVTFSGTGLTANRFVVDSGTLSGAAGAGLGVGYDVVVDVDRDGQLSAGDLIDGYGDEAGLYVVHDTVQPGPYAVTEVLYSGGTWLDQDTYYPTNIASLGQLPLVVVSHGNGHNYQWYDHIGNHLASYGFVVMSHSNNTGAGIDAASLSTLDNTDALLGNLGVLAGGALDGHVDPSRIMWIGHSRGGEGVVRAYDRLVDGTYVPNHFTKDDVRLISSMAPTAYLLPEESTSHDANYHLWVGQSDNDVSGCPHSESRQSYHLLDRATGQIQSISLEVAAPEVVRWELMPLLILPRERAFIECHTHDHSCPGFLCDREELCGGLLFEDVVDHLDDIEISLAHELDERVLILLGSRDSDVADLAFIAKLAQHLQRLRIAVPRAGPGVKLEDIDAVRLEIAQTLLDVRSKMLLRIAILRITIR